MFFKKLLILSAILFSAPLFAQECVQPTAPGIPSGRSASEEEMRETLDAVKNYLAVNMAFRECVDKQLQAIGDNTDHPLYDILKEAHQDSEITEELVADTFNTQLRIYKSTH